MIFQASIIIREKHAVFLYSFVFAARFGCYLTKMLSASGAKPPDPTPGTLLLDPTGGSAPDNI